MVALLHRRETPFGYPVRIVVTEKPLVDWIRSFTLSVMTTLIALVAVIPTALRS